MVTSIATGSPSSSKPQARQRLRAPRDRHPPPLRERELSNAVRAEPFEQVASFFERAADGFRVEAHCRPRAIGFEVAERRAEQPARAGVPAALEVDVRRSRLDQRLIQVAHRAVLELPDLLEVFMSLVEPPFVELRAEALERFRYGHPLGHEPLAPRNHGASVPPRT